MQDEIGFGFGAGEFLRREGSRLTFTDEPITWSKNEAYQDEYVAGFAVQDLDNNFFVGYLPVIVNLP
jgi:hypothetical protein